MPQQLVRPPALRMVRCGELSLRQCRHEKYFRLRKLFCLWKMHLCHRSSKCSHLRKPRRPWRTYHRRRSRTRRRAQCPQSGPGRPRASCIAALAPMRPSSTSTPAVWLAGLPTAVTRLTCTAVTANLSGRALWAETATPPGRPALPPQSSGPVPPEAKLMVAAAAPVPASLGSFNSVASGPTIEVPRQMAPDPVENI